VQLPTMMPYPWALPQSLGKLGQTETHIPGAEYSLLASTGMQREPMFLGSARSSWLARLNGDPHCEPFWRRR
jgi:hypothetical protein